MRMHVVPRPPRGRRRTDGTKIYPGSLVGEVHAGGETWSSALNGVRTTLGATRADTAIVRAQFAFAADTTMPAAGATVIATVRKLYTASAATAAFRARGLA